MRNLYCCFPVALVELTFFPLRVRTSHEKLQLNKESISKSLVRIEFHVKLKLPPQSSFKSRENHVSCRALQSYNSPGDWARQLFKPSANSASLVVEIEKKFFSFTVGVFSGERHKWGCFWLHLSGPGPNPLGHYCRSRFVRKLGQNPRL